MPQALAWTIGIVLLLFSGFLLLGFSVAAALGPVDARIFLIPFLGIMAAAFCLLIAYRKTAFHRRWAQRLTLFALVIPVTGLAAFSGFYASVIVLQPFFEKVVVIEREVQVDQGWRFTGDETHYLFWDDAMHECLRNRGYVNGEPAIATLHVTLHFGRVSFFRLVNIDNCDNPTPARNGNLIIPAYRRGEEIARIK